MKSSGSIPILQEGAKDGVRQATGASLGKSAWLTDEV